MEEKRRCVEREHPELSITRQCELLGLCRSSLYYVAREADPYNEYLMRRIDELYTQCPFYGVRRLAAKLRATGERVNEKRIRRLMRQMGLEAIYPKPRVSVSEEGQKRYPYLLRNFEPARPNQVWATDITYIRLRQGHCYLTAILDWFSRYVVSWKLSVSLEADFCVQALEEALETAIPEIFNSDQGSQFVSADFIGLLTGRDIAISMTGQGRVFDNILVERLWRSVKYEEVYLKDYGEVAEARESLGNYFRLYNHERPHQALAYRTPAEVHLATATANGNGSSKEG